MPLDDLALENHLQDLNIPPAGRDLIRHRREHGPVRRVQGGHSVMSRYASRKNGMTIQCESRTLEAPAVTLYENDPRVLSYADQPATLGLDYSQPGSHRKTTRHTPDFLVLRTTEAALEEWKAEAQLQELTISHPGKYVKDGDGRWHQPAAQRRAAALGMVHRVLTEADLPELLVRNWRLLDPHVGGAVADPAGVLALVRDVPGITIGSLLEQLSSATIAQVMALVAAGLIWVDLKRALLTDHHRVTLYENEECGRMLGQPVPRIPTGAVSLAAETKLRWSGVAWTVANAGPERITLENEAGKIKVLTREAVLELVRTGELRAEGPTVVDRASLLKDVPAELLEEAQARVAALRPYLEDGLRPTSRTHQRWLQKYCHAKATLGDGLPGLISKRTASEERKVTPEQLELAHAVITELVFTSARRPHHSGYKIYQQRCSDMGIKPISAPTYRDEIARLSDTRAIRRRLGRKVANALRGARPIGVLPVHGERAFDRVHVDHTRLDIVLIDSVTDEVLGRPWLTLAIDAYTRRIVGHVLTFSPPSAASVMLVMRNIVARYGRLPTTFVLDNGSDFTGVYFQTTAAAFEVSLEYRPPRDPRFGAVIESCFGKLNGALIHFLKGNTVGRKDVRSQDSENDAAKLAIWTLPALEENLSTYLHEVYDVLRSENSGLGSPRERFEESVRLAGVAEREAIADDQHFRIMTAPAIATRCRVGRQGIKAKRMRYWCDAFDRPGVRRSLVEVRWEPFDRSRAYAFVDGEWQVCYATHHQLLANRTERELQLASVELSARLKRTPSVRELALHLEETLKTEKALLEHRKSLEALKSGVVVPFPGRGLMPAAMSAPPPPVSAPRELESWE